MTAPGAAPTGCPSSLGLRRPPRGSASDSSAVPRGESAAPTGARTRLRRSWARLDELVARVRPEAKSPEHRPLRAGYTDGAEHSAVGRRWRFPESARTRRLAGSVLDLESWREAVLAKDACNPAGNCVAVAVVAEGVRPVRHLHDHEADLGVALHESFEPDLEDPRRDLYLERIGIIGQALAIGRDQGRADRPELVARWPRETE